MMFRRHPTISVLGGATAVVRRPPLRFSPAGAIYVSMMLFMGLAAMNSQANLLFGMFGLMIGVLLISGVIRRQVLHRLKVRRILPDHARVGEPVTLTYEFTNGKRFWPSMSVLLAELDGTEAFTEQARCFLLHAAPRSTASVSIRTVPKRRGMHRLHRHQLSTSFPFGFVRRTTTDRAQDVLLIHPPLADVSPRLLAMCRSADSVGETTRPEPGGADEFYGVREYRAGDNPRWIYWRRSARSGVMVSREMTRVAPPRVLILLDTFPAGPDLVHRIQVERCIAMAGSLAAAALDQGVSVGLCVWSDRWIELVPERGRRFRSELLSLLARLPANRAQGVSELLERGRSLLRPGTTSILFTPSEPSTPVRNPRGSSIVVAADSPRAASWFRFPESLDFAAVVPVGD